MNKLKIIITLFISALFFAGSANAQDNKNRVLTFEEAVGGRLFSARETGSVTWFNDGEGYSRLERNEATGGMDIVRYDASNNKRSVIVPSEKFINKATGKPIEIYSFTWSDDNSKILIFNNTKRVWRYNTKGDYWVLDIKSGELKQLNKGMEPSVTMFAKFNPAATKVAYVAKNNIYVEDLASGTITPLTTDGNDRFVNGTFDWVYEEEFDCRDGFRWSGDGKYIAYWHSDTEGTGVFYMINNVDSIYSQIIPFPYPKSGTTNSAVKVGYLPVEGGATTWIEIPGDPRNNYIMRMEFIPGTNELFIQQMNRHQSENKVWVVACGQKTPVNIFTDTDEAWTDPNDGIQWFRNNQYFTWLSDRSGYKHVYLVSRDGKEILPVTKGDLDIVNVAGIDAKNSFVYYITTPEGKYTQRYLYRSKFFGDGKMERVSPAGQEGTHSYNISPTGKWAIHSFNNTHTPPISAMISLPDHKAVRTIVENGEVKKEFDSWGFNYKEFVKADVGDYILDGWMIKPRDFDSNKKYPVILEIYGEPAASTVSDTWQPYPWYQYLANQGYIIMSIDNRGQRVPRGREWRKSIYQQIGIAAADDQAKAIVELGKQYSFIDMDRIGVTGWSGGGSMTLNCMFRYPDIYKTGIAVAFVSHQKLYNTIYQERYMRTPAENPQGYSYGSPITHAQNLKGNLLLMHGTSDDNVHYQSCEMLVDELIKHQKLFQLMSYPMRSHGIYERQGTSMHVRRVMDKFWSENLPAGARTEKFLPTSEYTRKEIGGFTVMVAKSALDSVIMQQALEKISADIAHLIPFFTEEQLRVLRQKPIWMQLRPDREGAACYHPDKQWLIDNDVNPDKVKCVDITNVRNYLAWTNQPYMLLHELAHLYHDLALIDGHANARVKEFYTKAKNSEKYDDVKYFNGKEITTKKAYAMNNEMEYFAELSESYFGRNDFYPFTYDELKEFDPDGFAMMEEIWGKRLNI